MVPFIFNSEIHLDHTGIALHRLHAALAEHMALVQHRDRAVEVADEVHVVLDHQHGVITRQAAQQLAGALRFLIGEPRHRFIHQQEVGVLGEQHGDLQPLLLAVGEAAGQLLGLGRQTHHPEQMGHPVLTAAIEAPEEQIQGERRLTASSRLRRAVRF